MNENIFSLDREHFEKLYRYLYSLLEYKKKKGFQTKIRLSPESFGGKHLDWIEENENLYNKEWLWDYVQKNNIISISYTILPNELVLEIDHDNNFKRTFGLLEFLKDLQLKPITIFSGHSSLHNHIFFNRALNKKERDALKKFFMKYFKLDEHGFSDNHPWRLPGSYNSKSITEINRINNGYADILLSKGYMKYSDDDINELVYSKVIDFSKFENDLDKLLEFLNIKIEDDDANKEIIKIKERTKNVHGKMENLRALYESILETKIEDGRNRVLLILFALGKKLNISPEQFKIDIEKWAELCEWKQYKYKKHLEIYENYDDYLKEGKYKYYSSLIWAIKRFIEANDIEKESKEKIEKLLNDFLPNVVRLIKEETDKNATE